VSRTVDRVDALARTVGDAAATTAAAPGHRVLRREGALLVRSGAPLPALNPLLTWSARVDPAVVRELVQLASAAAMPYSLTVRPGSRLAIGEVAARRGLRCVGETPLLVWDRPEPRRGTFGLRIRRLQPHEIGLHVGLVATGFGLSAGDLEPALGPDLLRAPGVVGYVAKVRGVCVATALGTTAGEWVGVHNLATAPEHRGRGYGSALVSAVVADGVRAGARAAWLQSSGTGGGVFARLGFRVVERWPYWVSWNG
jgi:GNAT superfamily N-acetyltransferase